MKKNLILILFSISFLILGTGVYYYTRSEDTPIKISSNPWVGFTPFIYAQEKGWLDKTPFKFVWQVDLSENSRLYERGFVQGFTATQYELLHFKDYSRLKPVFLIDRSFGADMILSNRSLQSLRDMDEPIKVYLEIGSLNEDFFRAFVRENGLEKLKFVFVNSNQNSMTSLSPSKTPVILISYDPYGSTFLKQGYKKIASTQTMQSFFVIDALFVDERFVEGRESQYRKLLEIFDQALEVLKNNPQEYYKTIKDYLEGQSYEDFMASTTQIKWLNSGAHEDMQEQLRHQHISTQRVLK